MIDRPTTPSDQGDVRAYRQALIDAGGHIPENVDWEAFHVRLAARAELSLARLRYPRLAAEASGQQPGRPVPFPGIRWWEPAARWSRHIVGAAIAAGIVLIAVVRMSPRESTELAEIGAVAMNSDPGDRTRAAFESAVVGRTATWTIDSALMPSATDLLIPLGADGAHR
jgi:hypothetical protein